MKRTFTAMSDFIDTGQSADMINQATSCLHSRSTSTVVVSDPVGLLIQNG